MAIKQWVSADGDFGAAASWNPAGVPLVGDTFIFDGIGSQLSVTAGLDQSLIGAFDRLITRPAYTGQIGTSSDPLHMQIDSTATGGRSRAIFRGSGDVHFKGEAGNFQDVVVDAPNANVYLNGSLRNVWVKAGGCEINAAASVSNSLLCVGDSALLVVNSGGGIVPLVVVLAGGLIEYKGDWTTANAWFIGDRGTAIFTERLGDNISAYVGERCRVVYRPLSAVGALYNPDITAAGVFDVGENWQDIELDNMVWLPTARILGAPVHQGDFSPAAVQIDLREDYP